MLLLLNWISYHHLFAVAAVYCGIAYLGHRQLTAELTADMVLMQQRQAATTLPVSALAAAAGTAATLPSL